MKLRGGIDQSFEADWEFLNALWTDGMCAKLQVVRTLYVDGHPDYFDDSLTDLLKCKRASAQARVLFEGKKNLIMGFSV